MTNKDSFTEYHPIINFMFFIGAIVCGMFYIHPYFVGVSVFCAAAYLITVRGTKAFSILAGMCGVFIVISIINPIFNTNGEHVLCQLFGRPYTLEALLYGMTLAGMMVSILLWFVSYQTVMTSDKFLYLFGGLSPAFSLVLTMILRLVPNYQKKIMQISEIRKSIGKSAGDGTLRQKTEHGITVLSVTTTWALEGGIVMADSMQSRGYGCGKRSRFSIYRMGNGDKLLLILMTLLLTITLVCGAKGMASITFAPTIQMHGSTMVRIGGLIVYMLFLMLPTMINIKENVTWHILRSKI
ncbi:MAG: energy-coupling factor transporter transmembrane component T [Eubacteriales bacterium]|nr:energy-coupling factor transporter transmembrane component T [Eubacteriales bacterium]